MRLNIGLIISCDGKIYALVSVIVPLYNHELYISQLLESIETDLYKNIEVLVCDDNSSDNSYDICRKKLKSSPYPSTLVKNLSNIGVSATLNRLVGMAKGEYILPIASDDFLTNSSIYARVEIFDKNQDIDVIIGDCNSVDEQGRPLKTSLVREGLGNIFDETDVFINRALIRRWCLPGPIMMYRRKTFQAVGGYDISCSQEDFDFFLRLVASEKIFYTSLVVAKYRKFEENTGRGRCENMRLTWENMCVCIKYLSRIGSDYRSSLIARMFKLFGGLFWFLLGRGR